MIHLKDCNKYEMIDMHRITGYTTNDPKELEANHFAVALLMPKNKVIEEYKKLSELGFSNDFIINMLSKIFFVSKVAINYRLRNLGLLREIL